MKSSLELVEPVLLLDEELIDAREGDVEFAQLLIFLEEVVEVCIKIDLNKNTIFILMFSYVYKYGSSCSNVLL